jgi:hypothetical protein
VESAPQRRRSPVEGESIHVDVDEHGSYRAIGLPYELNINGCQMSFGRGGDFGNVLQDAARELGLRGLAFRWLLLGLHLLLLHRMFLR